MQLFCWHHNFNAGVFKNEIWLSHAVRDDGVAASRAAVRTGTRGGGARWGLALVSATFEGVGDAVGDAVCAGAGGGDAVWAGSIGDAVWAGAGVGDV